MLERSRGWVALGIVVASCGRASSDRGQPLSSSTPTPTQRTHLERLSKIRGLSFIGHGDAPAIAGDRWSVPASGARPAVEGSLSGSSARISASAEAWVSMSRIDRGADRGEVTGGATSFADTTWAWSKRAVEHLHVVTTGAPIVLEMKLGSAIASVDVVRDRVWLKDAHGRALLETDTAWVEDAKGTRRALHVSAAGAPPSMQLTLTFESEGLVAPFVVDPAWTTVASMHEARVGAAGVTLADGRVLVIGGEADSSITGTYEIYDPTTNIWTEGTGGPALRQNDIPPRFAVLLTSGKVLAGPTGGGPVVAKVYDPVGNTWTSTPSVSPPGGTALAALPGGLGLIIGGYDPTNSSLPIATTTIVDPATHTVTAGPPMNRPRMLPAALTMPDGRILVAGDTTDRTDATTEYYDPTTHAWTYGPSMTKWRDGMRLVLLSNGDVGASGFAFDIDVLTAGAWRNVAALPGRPDGEPITGFSGIAPLPGGQALLLEWCFPDTCAKFNAQRFDGTSLLLADPPDVLRAAAPVVSPIAGGRVLVAGGAGLDEPLSVVEIFAPATPASPCTAPGTCASLACVDGYCCASTSCGAGSTCGGPAMSALGVCRLKNGQTCTTASECGSGLCVDGVCCNTACTGACEACDGAGSVGTCRPIAGAPHGTRTPCTPTPTTCGLACDGIDPTSCTTATSNTPCSGDACSGGLATHARFCDGAGNCPDVPTTCGAYVCGKIACKASCATNADCSVGFGCVASACVPLLAVGTTCTSDLACASGACVDGVCCGSLACDRGSACNVAGHLGACTKAYGAVCATSAECGEGTCVDGVCCDGACTGNCEACDVKGHEGTCTAVVGAPHGGRAACEAGANVCAARTCDGTTRASCTGYANGASATCAPATCSGGSAIAASACDGAGTCVAPAASSCSPYLCAKGACTTTCTRDSDCSSGFQCEASRCIPATVKCSLDGKSSVAPNGTTSSCSPYLCDATAGTCSTTCLSSTDCAVSFVCVAGQCIAPTSSSTAASSGGCSVDASRGRGAPSWLAVVCATILFARRRRTPRRSIDDRALVALSLLATMAACARHDDRVAARAPITAASPPTATPTTSVRGWSSATGASFDFLTHPVVVRLADGSVVTVSDTSIFRFDPTTNVNKKVGALVVERQQALGALLPSGKVLIAGGIHAGTTFVTSAELFDPSTNTSTATASMSTGRAQAGLVTLPSGKVLACGSLVTTSPNCDLYEEGTATWTPAAPMPVAAYVPALFVLPSGKVLSAPLSGTSAQSQIYDPVADSWTSGPKMQALRYDPGITVMASGKILFIGGDDSLPASQTAEVYDPIANTFTATTQPLPARVQFCAAAPLPSGRAICIGGLAYSSAIRSVPLVYDPIGGNWYDASPLPTAPAQAGSGAIALADGRVLFTTPAGAPYLFKEQPVGASCAGAGDCENLQCVDGVCCGSKACPSGSQCAVGSGTCMVSNGGACTSGSACASGNCVDGYCCNTACTEQCGACNVAGALGTCSPVLGVPRGSRAACGGAGVGTVCGARCDGKTSTQCTFAASSVVCGSNDCASGIQTNVATCDGAGGCADTSVACAPYACGATSCRTTCTTSSDCAAGRYCASNACVPVAALGVACTNASECASAGCVDGVCCATSSCAAGYVCNDPASKGTCVLPLGTACTLSAQCATGQCIDGVCCDKACDGQCEACDVSGKAGTCSPVDGAPHGARPGCASADAAHPCAATTCVGAKDTATCAGFLAGATTQCAPSSCASSTFTPASTCDGAGACVAPTGASCAPYACNAKGCLSSCTLDLDCASGFICRATACVPRADECTADLGASVRADGTVTACAPYVCGTNGTCGTTCASSAQCAPGGICDTASQTCKANAGATSGGGCGVGRGGASKGSAWMALFVGMAWAKRRRGWRSRS